VRPIVRPSPPPPPAPAAEVWLAAFDGDETVDWRALLSAECGPHAARRLHRALTSPAATAPERTPAASDRTPTRIRWAFLKATAAALRWMPSPR
jgi:hypothetical protein